MDKKRLLELAGVDLDEGKKYNSAGEMLRDVLKRLNTAVKYYEIDDDERDHYAFADDIKGIIEHFKDAEVKVK